MSSYRLVGRSMDGVGGAFHPYSAVSLIRKADRPIDRQLSLGWAIAILNRRDCARGSLPDDGATDPIHWSIRFARPIRSTGARRPCASSVP
jgi:hypothetical protein